MHLELDNVVLVPRYILPAKTITGSASIPPLCLFGIFAGRLRSSNLCFVSALLVRTYAFAHDGCGVVISGFDH